MLPIQKKAQNDVTLRKPHKQRTKNLLEKRYFWRGNMASAFSRWLVDPRRNPLAAFHKKSLDHRLRKYGLRYDDLYDPMYDLDIKEALNRLPREVVDARNQRLKRALDLSLKHKYLPEDVQAQQTPFRSYLQDMLALVKRERAEREALGALPLYQRTIP